MTKEQRIIQSLITELEFVANNPNARSAKSIAEYADDLLFAIKVQMKPEAVKKWAKS